MQDTTTSHPAAYEQKVWSYTYAPAEYKAFFAPPNKPGHKAFIVWERRVVRKGMTEWVTPDGTWWELWHNAEKHEIDETTNVYLLIEKTASE